MSNTAVKPPDLTLSELTDLVQVIVSVYNERGDDLCWMDIDRIFAACKLPVPDRSVGDKVAMKKNCDRFIDTMCSGGKWESYADLEDKLEVALSTLRNIMRYSKENFARNEAIGAVVACTIVGR